MRPVLIATVLSMSLAAAACAPSAEEGADTSDGALRNDASFAAAGFVFHVQAPLPVVPGQALSSARVEPSGWSKPTVLPERCIGGSPTSLAHAAGHNGQIGYETSSAIGLVGPGRPGFGDAPQEPFWVSSFEPTLMLEAKEAYTAALKLAPTRVSGSAFIETWHNGYHLVDERRLSSGDACGTHWVRSVRTARMLAFGVALDFPTEQARARFGEKYPSGVNALLEPAGGVTPSPRYYSRLQEDLRGLGVRLQLHVFVTQEFSGKVKEALANDTCALHHLAGCRPAFDHLAAAMREVGADPGHNEVLEDVTGPDATWGIYSAKTAGYEIVP